MSTKNAWLDQALAEHEELMRKFEDLQRALDRSNLWAEALNQELRERRARVEELQGELMEAQENSHRAISRLERNLRTEVATAVDALHHTEKELEHRTAWASRLAQDNGEMGRQLRLYLRLIDKFDQEHLRDASQITLRPSKLGAVGTRVGSRSGRALARWPVGFSLACIRDFPVRRRYLVGTRNQ